MDKVYITGLVQKILNKEFANQNKRRFVDYHDRLNFSCPYCGDSHKNQYAKRGNLYFNRLIFIIFIIKRCKVIKAAFAGHRLYFT